MSDQPDITTYYPLNDEDEARIKTWRHFKSHGDQSRRFIKINQSTKRLAIQLMEICPRSKELTQAIDALENCRLQANMAIMKNEVDHGP